MEKKIETKNEKLKEKWEFFFRMVGSEMKMGKTKHIYRHQEWHIIIRYFNDSHINGRQCKEYEYICDNVNINVHLAVICKLKRFGVRWNKMKCNYLYMTYLKKHEIWSAGTWKTE